MIGSGFSCIQALLAKQPSRPPRWSRTPTSRPPAARADLTGRRVTAAAFSAGCTTAAAVFGITPSFSDAPPGILDLRSRSRPAGSPRCAFTWSMPLASARPPSAASTCDQALAAIQRRNHRLLHRRPRRASSRHRPRLQDNAPPECASSPASRSHLVACPGGSAIHLPHRRRKVQIRRSRVRRVAAEHKQRRHLPAVHLRGQLLQRRQSRTHPRRTLHRREVPSPREPSATLI